MIDAPPQRNGHQNGQHAGSVRICEEGILSAIVCRAETLDDLPTLRPEHFHEARNSLIYATCRRLWAAGRRPDILGVAEDIAARGDIAEQLGADWLRYLQDLGAYSATSQPEYYAAQLIEAGERRRLRLELERIQQRLADPSEAVPEIARSVREAVEAVDQTSLRPVSAASLFADDLRLREPVVDGICRRGEVVNIIAASKVGKSWLSYGLLFAVATGQAWHGHHCRQGRVLLIDNELHPELLASRLRTVGDAMGLQPDQYASQIDVLSLRGRLVDIFGLRSMLQGLRSSYAAIVLDALYRFQPSGHDENSNGGTTAIYNTLDAYAAMTNAAVVAIHHASKGNQAGKAVTDVGSGAGAMSRAADTHLVLRPHEQEGCVVMEAAIRSFAPLEPIVLRWEFPLWQVDGSLDPAALQTIPTRQDEQQASKDREGCDAIVEALRAQSPLTASKIRKATGLSFDRANRLIQRMRSDGRLVESQVVIRGNTTEEYTLPEYLQYE